MTHRKRRWCVRDYARLDLSVFSNLADFAAKFYEVAKHSNYKSVGFCVFA